MRKKVLRFFSVFILAAALWVLYREFHRFHFHDILLQIEAIPFHQIMLAILAAILSYAVLIGYDMMAVRYAGRRLGLIQIIPVSFISYAFSNNIANPLVSGAIRYRLYSSLGLTALEVGQVIIFCGFTLWLGFLFLGGIFFVAQPVAFPGILPLSLTIIRLIGIFFLLLVTIYLLLAALHKQRIKIGKWSFAMPSLRLAIGQFLVSGVDWAIAGTVLYLLLPPTARVSYPEFLSAFMLAQIAGLISQVPAGLGVFETLMVLFFKPVLPADVVLGILITYRVIYYLLPLLLAMTFFSLIEIRQRQHAVSKVVELYGKWLSPVIPYFFMLTTFIAGVILLFSGATPAVHSRLLILMRFLPLPVIELSHFLGSLAGAGLLLLARGLQRRLDGAYFLTIVLLAVGAAVSLLKGFDYEEAIILGIMLFTLYSCRSEFYRKASLIEQRFTAGWMISIAIVLASSIWLGFFAFKHVEYSSELWWQFSLHGDASRFMRASVGVVSMTALSAWFLLIRSGAPKKLAKPTAEERVTIGEIVRNAPQTYAYLALLGDKYFLFSSSRQSFIMYGISGSSWIAMGDPVGLETEYEELVWQFRETCSRHGGWPVFYAVGQTYLPLYIDQGLTLLKLGEDARVPLKNFSLEGSSHKTMRHTLRKLESDGASFAIVPQAEIAAVLPELEQISNDWLSTKNANEKRFSLGNFNPDYLLQTPAAVIRFDQKIVAFANLWCSGQKEELSIDLMRYSASAPSGIMDFLFLNLMLWGQKEGYAWFNLGMAPFAGIENRDTAPLWNRISSFLYRYGEHFYNFQGLRQYKDKFDPQWQPKYLASPGGAALPVIFANIASLNSEGLRGVVSRSKPAKRS
jgi:phosphatidylglycerol lysyltransferase